MTPRSSSRPPSTRRTGRRAARTAACASSAPFASSSACARSSASPSSPTCTRPTSQRFSRTVWMSSRSPPFCAGAGGGAERGGELSKGWVGREVQGRASLGRGDHIACCARTAAGGHGVILETYPRSAPRPPLDACAVGASHASQPLPAQANRPDCVRLQYWPHCAHQEGPVRVRSSNAPAKRKGAGRRRCGGHPVRARELLRVRTGWSVLFLCLRRQSRRHRLPTPHQRWPRERPA
eukprot:scaffold30046_cov146-Isochrysis_galbana.AAC.4